jgi:hypothetical protein
MKIWLAILLVLSAFILVSGFVSAYTETMKLSAGETLARDVQLNADDVISGRVTIVGTAINFSVTDPENTVTLSYTLNNPVDFKFTAERSGNYQFHFDNQYSTEVKYVTFNYNVQRYIFGFPQEFVILFVIVGVGLVAVVIFVAASPKP